MDLYDSIGMLNSAIQYAGAQIGAVKDKKWIAKENEKARQFQLEMWNKANEYNMPSAVLNRYAQAGIQVNPNYLVTGKYDGGLTSVVSAPGHSAPNMGSKDIANYMNLLGGVQLQSQIDVNKSIEAKNYEEAFKAKKEGEKISTEGEIMSSSKEDLIDINKRTAYILENQGVINYNLARKMENDADFSDYWRETEFSFYDSSGNYRTETGWQLDVWKAIEEYRKLGFDNQQINKVIGKLGAEIQDIYTGIEVKEQTIQLMESQKFLNLAQADYYKAAEYMSACLAAKYNMETKRMNDLLYYERFQSYWNVFKTRSEVNLNDVNEKSLWNEIYQSIQNNELDRFLRSVPQRYKGTAGTVLSFLYEVFFSVHEGGSPYYSPKK